jgi:hypothetical protein
MAVHIAAKSVLELFPPSSAGLLPALHGHMEHFERGELQIDRN